MAPTSLNLDSLPAPILILAPQGAEHRAIAKGLRSRQRGEDSRFSLQSIPAGQQALIPFLKKLGQTWTNPTKPQALLVMGVTGSLNLNYGIGQPVLVTESKMGPQATSTATFPSDSNLVQTLSTALTNLSNSHPRLPFVKGITTYQVIGRATEKQALAHRSGADVVDMENTVILEFAQQHSIPTAILRVVSDTVDHDLPDLQNIYDGNGNLKPWRLTIRFIRRPLAAARLIRGSLIACSVLQQLAATLAEV